MFGGICGQIMEEREGWKVFSLFFRGAILYVVMIVLMRGLGKREMGQFQPYELALTILLADVISAPMESVATPLLHGLLPVAAIFVVYGVITLLSVRSDKVRAFLSGKPTLVISRGVIDRKELDKLCLSLADLLEGLRGQGFLDPAEVGTAVVEANGSISAFPRGEARGPRNDELGICPGYEGLPMILIMDGRVQDHNLTQTGRDRRWLESLLAGRRLSTGDVYLASLDTRGGMLLQLKSGSVVNFPAMEPGEVMW